MISIVTYDSDTDQNLISHLVGYRVGRIVQDDLGAGGVEVTVEDDGDNGEGWWLYGTNWIDGQICYVLRRAEPSDISSLVGVDGPAQPEYSVLSRDEIYWPIDETTLVVY